jgi:hypothetical protein
MQKVDNVPMLQLDIVWCYFMLRDVSCLEVAGTHLNKSRLRFERSHGKDSTRFRLAIKRILLCESNPFLALPYHIFGVNQVIFVK